MLEAQERAKHIRLEHRSEAVWRLLNHRTRLAFRASIVDGDIEAAESRDGLVDHGADVILLTDVGVDELGLRTERAQLLSERLAGLISNHHVRTLLREGDCGGTADAGETAGDQDDWVVAHLQILAMRSTPTGRAWPRGKSRQRFGETVGLGP
jgi:hypothetical protein